MASVCFLRSSRAADGDGCRRPGVSTPTPSLFPSFLFIQPPLLHSTPQNNDTEAGPTRASIKTAPGRQGKQQRLLASKALR